MGCKQQVWYVSDFFRENGLKFHCCPERPGGSFGPPKAPHLDPPHFRGREGGREGARGGVQTSGFGIGGRDGARGGERGREWVGGGERGARGGQRVRGNFLLGYDPLGWGGGNHSWNQEELLVITRPVIDHHFPNYFPHSIPSKTTSFDGWYYTTIHAIKFGKPSINGPFSMANW